MPEERPAPSPLISIVTVTRHSAADLPACLDSVAAQEGADFEHRVVDGASTDGTADLLRARDDPRLHWISEPDRGIYDAMAKAVRLAKGRWIYFLGADDRLRPGVLREMAAHLKEPNTLYYGDVWMTHRKIRYAGRFPAWKLALKNLCQQAIFYPREVFEVHAFEEKYAIQADWVLNMACRRDPQFRLEYVPVVVADFNDAGGVSSVRRDLAIERDYVPLLRRYFPAWISWPLSAAVFGWRLVKGKKWP
jgi:glycosyltransferase involved in cell wall biosynthesis